MKKDYSKRNPRNEERIKGLLLEAQVSAARHVKAIVEGNHAESSLPWKEASTRTRASLLLSGIASANERAKTTANAGPKVFGVVVMPPMIRDAAAWEAKAQAMISAERPAIEAVAEPEKKQ